MMSWHGWFAILAIALLAACAPTNTTLRFVNNREVVMVQNLAKPKAGDKIEGLINTYKKIYFMYPRGTFDFTFNPSVDVKPGERKRLAAFSVGQSSLRLTALKLRHALPIVGPPTPETRALICAEPAIANILSGRSTEIVTLGKGTNGKLDPDVASVFQGGFPATC